MIEWIPYIVIAWLYLAGAFITFLMFAAIGGDSIARMFWTIVFWFVVVPWIIVVSTLKD